MYMFLLYWFLGYEEGEKFQNFWNVLIKCFFDIFKLWIIQYFVMSETIMYMKYCAISSNFT